MQLDVYIENVGYTIEVDEQDIANGQSFFSQMDSDMDGGWRMGPEYVHDPDITQRCQIVAERLMLSMEKQNESMVRAMAAYIVWRIPGIRELHIDTSGEPLLTEIIT
jgi:hypothetical protein